SLVRLPALDGLFRDAERCGRLPSDESFEEPGFLEMIAQGPQLPRTPPRGRHWGGKAQMVKGQLIPRERGEPTLPAFFRTAVQERVGRRRPSPGGWVCDGRGVG